MITKKQVVVKFVNKIISGFADKAIAAYNHEANLSFLMDTVSGTIDDINQKG